MRVGNSTRAGFKRSEGAGRSGSGLITRMRQHLQANNQVILFLIVGVLRLRYCATTAAGLPNATLRSLLHAASGATAFALSPLDSQRPVPRQCPSCGSTHLVPWGWAPNSLNRRLRRCSLMCHFSYRPRYHQPQRGAGTATGEVHRGGARILIGTQMLAKGPTFRM